MARILALIFVSLLTGGQAKVMPESLRVQGGECARSDDNDAMFTVGAIAEALPSETVKQAETDVVSAEFISIEYFTNYKVLTEKMSKELYVLTQCGTTPPSSADLSSVMTQYPGYTVKHFTIPLQVVASSSTIHLAFFDALGVQDRVKNVSEYATGPCWQKALNCGGKYSGTDLATQIDEFDAVFMDCNWDGTCDNVNGQAKAVHISASQDPAPLHSAEHIKFIAAFFNKEALASQLFASTLSAYKSASEGVTASSKPVVAWISYNAKSQWSAASFVLSQASYKLKMVLDAGGTNVDAEAVAHAMGGKMTMTSSASGKTYTVLESGFGDDKAQASAAFFAALGQVDVIIDEVYAFAPKSYNFATFLETMGLASSSTLKFMQNKMVLRIDGTISENDGLDWYESRVAHPDWAVEGLARQLGSTVSKPYRYFRNIAKSEEPQVLDKSMCTANVPACEASAYPSVIDMMIAVETTSKAVEKCLGILVLLFLVVLEA